MPIYGCRTIASKALWPTTKSRQYFSSDTIPVLSSHCDYSSVDHLISEMNRRFSEHQKTAFLGLNLIPSILVKKPLCEVESVLLPLESMYTSDLQDDSFKPELHQWYLKWKKEEDTHVIQALPNTLAFILPHCSSYFANIQILLRILYTLPVTSCSSERSFSALKRIKTHIRSSMTNDRLTSFTLLHIHHDIAVDIPK